MNSRLPSLRGIEAFVSAAETLSFGTTAQRLHLTVSAVSHRIHALEEEIGLRLFDRTGRSPTLTPAGIAYRDRLLPIIGALQKATHAIYGATESKVLRIATFQLFHVTWLAPRIGRFIAQHPDAEIELLTLRRRKVIHPDITIRILRSGEEGVESEQLFRWDVSPFCRPELVREHKLRDPADLHKVTLIESASSPDVWQRWLAKAGQPTDMPYRSILVDLPSLTLELASQGQGVGMIATFMAERYLAEGMVFPFDIRCDYPGGVFVNRPSEFERPIVKAFREWLRKEVDATVEKTSTPGENMSLVAAE